MTQLSLIDGPDRPEHDVNLSQWFTPLWICRLLAAWVPPTAYVIEPSCGSGNMIAALLERGHSPDLIVGIELDERWVVKTRARFGNTVQILHGNFLTWTAAQRMKLGIRADIVMGNPPFEGNAHERFVLQALHIAPLVAFVLPVSIEYSRDRDHHLWAQKGIIKRRAKLPDRVKYGGKHQAMFDTEVLKIARRTAVREPGEINVVPEEVWTRIDKRRGK